MLNRVDIINYCIKNYNYQSYLEIGCQNNFTFNNVIASKKTGVDPVSGGTHRMMSDDFFFSNTDKFDIVFIDGDHRCRQVAKDVINSLTCLNEHGIIVLHDCCPPTKADESTENIRCADAWKALVHFRQFDTLDAACGEFDFGIGMIKLKKNSDKISVKKHFTELVWDDFVENKRSWLRLLNESETLSWLSSY